MEQSVQLRIRNRAYEMWNGSGRLDGQADHHWLAAEREVLAHMTQALSAPKADTAIESLRPRAKAKTSAGRQRIAKAS
jgi:Protein of unknown function (DUF2934)